MPATTTAATAATTTTNENNNTENEHLLENKWVLWYRPPANSAANAKTWETSQKVKFTADTVESFWRGYNALARIRQGHPVNCDYSLFKDGIKPMWEDDFNEKGGRWTYTVERRQQSNNVAIPSVIAQAWLDVMLCLIGEGFDPYGDQIGGGVCGLRASKGGGSKPGDNMIAKIHIWTKDASNAEANMKIGEILQEVLHAPPGSLSYSPHDTVTGGGRKSYSYKL